MKDKKLSGKVAVVTGGSKEIGAAIAKALATEGAAVIVNYSSSKAEGEKVAKEIAGDGGKAVAVQANLSKAKDIEALFAEAKKAFGRVDILVNNAGIYEFAPLEQITEENFHKQFNLNVLGPLLASQAAAKLFDGDGGCIINISSVVSTTPLPQSAVYSGTKGAVDAITRVLAAELGPRKIRVNAIRPGWLIRKDTVRLASVRAICGSRLRRKRRWAVSARHRISPARRFSLRRMMPHGSRAKRFSFPEAIGNFHRCGQPGQQQGRRLPSLSSYKPARYARSWFRLFLRRWSSRSIHCAQAA